MLHLTLNVGLMLVRHLLTLYVRHIWEIQKRHRQCITVIPKKEMLISER